MANDTRKITRRTLNARMGGWLNRCWPALALLTLVAMAAFAQVLAIRPFALDDLAALQVGSSVDLSLFTGSILDFLPGYRPLPPLTVWLEQLLFGITPSAHFYLVNLGLVLAAGMLAYLLASWLGARSLLAVGAGVLFLVDPRMFAAVIWIGERQATMAVVFGCAALLLAYTSSRFTTRERTVGAVIGALLLAAALSKEYGLAFAAAVMLVWLCDRGKVPRAVPMAVTGAVVVYAAMRLGLAEGASAPFCETEGIGFSSRHVCFDDPLPGVVQRYDDLFLLSTGEAVKQYTWNVFSTFVGTFVPTLFTSDGALVTRNPGALLNEAGAAMTAFYAAVASLAVVAWIKVPRRTLPLLGLIVANALLSFVIYRTRNQMVGWFALYVSAGLGATYILDLLNAQRKRVFAGVGISVLAVTVGILTNLRSQEISEHLVAVNAVDPCRYVLRAAPLPGQFNSPLDLVSELKLHYGLPDPHCETTLASP